MTRLAFWRGLVMDPVTKDASSSRCCALFFALLTAYAVHRGCDGSVIASLVGGGVVALLTRKAAADA